MEVKTSCQQIKRIKGYIEDRKIYSEQLWTTFLFYSIKESKYPERFIKKLLNDDVENTNIKVWLEAQPVSPKKGKRGETEGNTVIDAAFGGIKKRGNTKSGIVYDNLSNYVCFVEAKILSDLGKAVTYDPLRNQMARIIENIVVFQDDKENFPEKIYFTILSPRIFKNNDRSRFYGYKIKEYSENRNMLYDDIIKCKLENRNEEKWKYPNKRVVEERVKGLKINWVTYEEIIEEIFDMQNLDILNPNYDLINKIDNMNINKINTS